MNFYCPHLSTFTTYLALSIHSHSLRYTSTKITKSNLLFSSTAHGSTECFYSEDLLGYHMIWFFGYRYFNDIFLGRAYWLGEMIGEI